MAAARSRASLQILRIKNLSLTIESRICFTRRFTQTNDSSSSLFNNTPLLQKLLKASISRIKTTLDSELDTDSSEFPWNALLTTLNASAPQKAKMVIEWKLEKLTKENAKNQDSYSRLISLCPNTRNLPTALLVFTSMETQGVKPSSSIFNALIKTSLSSGNLLTALSLFEIMECSSKGYKPDSCTYDAFISAYLNMGNVRETESWFLAKKGAGFSYGTENYCFVISCCVKSRKLEDAENYYEEMMMEKLTPNESIFRNMIMMYYEKRNFGKVKEFLNLFMKVGGRIDMNMARKIVGLYRELGLVKEMEELLVKLTEFDQNLEVLSVVRDSIARRHANADRSGE